MNKMSKTIEIECPDCKGFGLYRGRCEERGSAVVCHTCEGTGKSTFTYNEFTGRKHVEGVKRVFYSSCGYQMSAEDATTKEGVLLKFTEGGCTYEEWEKGTGNPRIPVKTLYCPYEWNNQGVGNEPLKKCAIGIGMRIYGCSRNKDKAECWKEYEKTSKYKKALKGS